MTGRRVLEELHSQDTNCKLLLNRQMDERTNNKLPKFECLSLSIISQNIEWISFLPNTVQILCIGTDRSQQTVQTKIRLLLKKQSDQGLRCLPCHQHLLDALMKCYIKLFYF